MGAVDRGNPRSARVAYIDGIRGLTAFGVVLTHIVWEVSPNGDGAGLPLWAANLTHPFAFANKVAIFIVLSGYGLARSAKRHTDENGLPQLSGGLRQFLLRRARRILPAYYAMLALTLLLIAAVPAMHTTAGVRWDGALPPAGAWYSTILAHLLLLHNMSPDWVTRLDPPMWSLAVEWQMYFVFALLLLPIWRRFGIGVVAILGMTLGFAPHFLLPAAWNYGWTAPWYLGLFCLGMATAVLTDRADDRMRDAARLGIIVTGLVFAALVVAGPVWCNEQRHPFVDLMVGEFTACLLIYGAVCGRLGYPSRLLSLLSRRIPVALGRLSYSLYLIHFPVLSLLHAGLRHCHITREKHPLWLLAGLLIFGPPLCLLATTLFHRLFETPFMGKPSRIVTVDAPCTEVPG